MTLNANRSRPLPIPETGLVKRPVLAGRPHNDPQTGKYDMTDRTAIQRIKELDQERAALFEQAKEEALRRANQAVEDLNALGLNYRLVTGAAPSGGKAAAKKPQAMGQTGADKKRGARPPA
jgi:hypothetical protein